MQAQLNVNGVSCYLQAKHDYVLIERKRTMPKIIQSYDKLWWSYSCKVNIQLIIVSSTNWRWALEWRNSLRQTLTLCFLSGRGWVSRLLGFWWGHCKSHHSLSTTITQEQFSLKLFGFWWILRGPWVRSLHGRWWGHLESSGFAPSLPPSGTAIMAMIATK